MSHDPFSRGSTSHISRRGAIGKIGAAAGMAVFGPSLAAHLKSLQDYPPRQGADTLSMKKAIDEAMKKMESPSGSSN